MDELIQSFSQSLHTGYIDKSILSNPEYQPELLVNQRVPPKKVLSTILYELENCNQFFISVAFVTTSGVATIINKLKELEARGVKGEILVSQYLNFTQPVALRRLLQFKNIDLRIATTGNAHVKGYIFKCQQHYNLIVGSSNLTAHALATNKEWNIKVSALDASGIVEKVLHEFQSDFKDATPVTGDYILSYAAIYRSQFLFNQAEKLEDKIKPLSVIRPNSMQIEALENLKSLRLQAKNKALIISATGTGKTYLSAFDAKVVNPKKLLFVVHRLTIAKDALNTFRSVFGHSKSMGLYSGGQTDFYSDFIFSTIQTISKPDHLANFSKDHFDYIIIDETHRSGAETYLRLINYFEPKFLLGMTATPERTDGNSIFEVFDHNIAYEIRLNRAMEEEMLSTFHYYGIADLSIDNLLLDKHSDFKYLLSNERVNHIIEKAKFYGSDNGITRGLIFCSRKHEAVELSALFNAQGFNTVALTGEHSEAERAKAIELIESDNMSEKLDYIFTVDIFNEGIDIPKINQIILLRPTESAIIFIQQLGRGLRKVDGKSYLTVIDFIGNYENNYLIPIALYGDTSYNKDSLRKLLTEGSRMIPGASTINFDEITKERIFQSIDSANMQLLADLKKDYNLLKFKLGRAPMMMDFIEHGSRDPYLFVEYDKSYYNFRVRVDKTEDNLLSSKQVRLLELFSAEINNSKRLEESLMLKLLIEGGNFTVIDLKRHVSKNYGYMVTDETIESCIINLNFEFVREKYQGQMLSVKEIYSVNTIELENGNFVPSAEFSSHLENDIFKTFLLDSTNYSIHVFDKLFELDKWRKGFVLYRKYSRKDVFRILNVPVNPIAQNVGGYLVSQDNEHCPIFVNYHKEDHIAESTKYEDEFVNTREFDWMSKSNRTLNSSDVQSILGHHGTIRLPLFIKKNNDEGMDFYYMGDMNPELQQVEQTTMGNDSGQRVSVVKIRFRLNDPVTPTLYNYFQERSVVKKVKPPVTDKIIPIQRSLDLSSELKNPIPLYSFYAAAGTFSEMQADKDYVMIEGPENGSSREYFACRIIGESMNRIIPNGSICLFRPDPGGSRNGKIVLVENLDRQDQDFNSSFTIKTYMSQKVMTIDGERHTSITLRPNSFDSSYKDIIIDEESARNMKVVGVFVKILDSK